MPPCPCPSFSRGKILLPCPHCTQNLTQQMLLPLLRQILHPSTKGILVLLSPFPFVLSSFSTPPIISTPFNCFSSSCSTAGSRIERVQKHNILPVDLHSKQRGEEIRQGRESKRAGHGIIQRFNEFFCPGTRTARGLCIRFAELPQTTRAGCLLFNKRPGSAAAADLLIFKA